MSKNSVVPIIVALISAAGGIIAVRAVPKDSPSAEPLPTSSIELSQGATAEGSNIINGDAKIIMSPRGRTKKNASSRQVAFATSKLLPWATLDALTDPQVSERTEFRGDSQGLLEADQELWLYVSPHGNIPSSETQYDLSPVEVNNNNGRWVATDVAIGTGEQSLDQRFEIGLLIAPAESIKQRTFKLGELPGTVQSARTFVVRPSS